MAIVLGPNQYGKAEVRLVKVTRDGDRHHVKDLNVSSSLRGDFEAAHVSGDNSSVVTTDTQKNTVYALAREHGITSIEEFAMLLGRHFTRSFDWVSGGRWAVEELTWNRIPVDGVGHDHAFSRDGSETRNTVVTMDGNQTWVVSGLSDLTILKSTGSEFWGFPRDRFTTLGETKDRILATSVNTRWRYAASATPRDQPPRDQPLGDQPARDPALGLAPDVDFDAAHADVRRIMLEAFATTHSYALQQSLYVMGEKVLEAHPEIAEIKFSMPNKHHFLVDLAPFGLDNPNEVFFAADRPYGLIEGTVTRDDAPPAGRAWETIPGFC